MLVFCSRMIMHSVIAVTVAMRRGEPRVHCRLFARYATCCHPIENDRPKLGRSPALSGSYGLLGSVHVGVRAGMCLGGWLVAAWSNGRFLRERSSDRGDQRGRNNKSLETGHRNILWLNGVSMTTGASDIWSPRQFVREAAHSPAPYCTNHRRNRGRYGTGLSGMINIAQTAWHKFGQPVRNRGGPRVYEQRVPSPRRRENCAGRARAATQTAAADCRPRLAPSRCSNETIGGPPRA
jgi:hypothetical protein